MNFQANDQCKIEHLNGVEAENAGLIGLFERISTEENWKPGTAIRDYVLSSTYLAAFYDGELVGGIQLVRSSFDDAWWPSRAVWPECDPGPTNDIGHVLILALQKSSRGRPDLFLRLCIELWKYCKLTGIRELRLECTPTVYRIYERVGMPLKVIGLSRMHWGENCIPVSLTVHDIDLASRKKASRLPSYRFVLSKSLKPKSA